MTTSNPLSHSRPVHRLAVSTMALALIAALAIVFLSGQRSSADPTGTDTAGLSAARVNAGTHGTGRTIKGQWFGTWKLNGGVGFCVEFNKGHPNSSGTSQAGSSLPSMSRETSARVKYIANQYGTTKNQDDAAAAAIVVWHYQGTKRFNDYYKSMLKKKAFSKTILRRVKEIKAESLKHGPYKLTMALAGGYPGQVVSGVVTARAQNNAVVAGKVLTLTSVNSTVVAKSRSTNANGQFGFKVRVDGPGAFRVYGRLQFKSSNGLLLTRPTAGHQRLLLAGAALDTAKVTASSVKTLRGPTVASQCEGDCKGIAPVKVTTRNPSAWTIRQYVIVDNHVKGHFDVPAGKIISANYNISDASLVTTKHCYLGSNNRCRTTVVDSKTRLTVVCPPLIEFKFAVDCPCDGARAIAYSVRAPAGSKRTYNAYVIAKNAAGQTVSTKSVAITPGSTTWVPFSGVSLSKGITVTLTMSTAGLNRTFTLDSITSNL